MYILTPLHFEPTAAVQTTNRHSKERWPKLISQLVAFVSILYVITLWYDSSVPPGSTPFPPPQEGKFLFSVWSIFIPSTTASGKASFCSVEPYHHCIAGSCIGYIRLPQSQKQCIYVK